MFVRVQVLLDVLDEVRMVVVVWVRLLCVMQDVLFWLVVVNYWLDFSVFGIEVKRFFMYQLLCRIVQLRFEVLMVFLVLRWLGVKVMSDFFGSGMDVQMMWLMLEVLVVVMVVECWCRWWLVLFRVFVDMISRWLMLVKVFLSEVVLLKLVVMVFMFLVVMLVSLDVLWLVVMMELGVIF